MPPGHRFFTQGRSEPMQPDLLDLHVLHHFRTRSPLTHCMTNDVVQTFTANVLLALGASRDGD
jgi:hydroxyethylthiazole kinase